MFKTYTTKKQMHIACEWPLIKTPR